MSHKTQERIEGLPSGKLKVKKQNDNLYYYRDTGDSGVKYLNKKNHKVVEELMQKEYLEQVQRVIEKEQNALKFLNRTYPGIIAEEVYENLIDERKAIVRPIVPTDEQFVRNWLERPYTPKTFPNDAAVYKTLKGERVRNITR